jgi:hypothetical protein
MLECSEQRATQADRSEGPAESCAGLHSFRAVFIGLGGALLYTEISAGEWPPLILLAYLG